MNDIIIPEPISKSIFDTYYQLIEKLRTQHYGARSEEYSDNLNFLEKIVTALERSLQDITSDQRFLKK
jgi:hypothetical protein